MFKLIHKILIFKRIITATIEGGNGNGAVLEPVLVDRKREIFLMLDYYQNLVVLIM